MPKPRYSEGKEQFVARCISEITEKEGLTTDEAENKCFLMWKRSKEEYEPSKDSKE